MWKAGRSSASSSVWHGQLLPDICNIFFLQFPIMLQMTAPQSPYIAKRCLQFDSLKKGAILSHPPPPETRNSPLALITHSKFTEVVSMFAFFLFLSRDLIRFSTRFIIHLQREARLQITFSLFFIMENEIWHIRNNLHRVITFDILNQLHHMNNGISK